jgi:lysyl endopeptidase
MSYRVRLLPCALALCLAGPAVSAAEGIAHGEASQSRPAAPLAWRGAAYRNLRSIEMRYDAMPAERLLQLQTRNVAHGMKAPQIGIGRRAGVESRLARLPRLQWMGDSRGNAVARVRIASPDAVGLRVGLDVSRLPDGVELRFAGSARPNEIVAMVRAADAKRLPGPDGLYWTPNTDGEAQLIELFRPAGVKVAVVSLEAPMLSHLVADSRNSFKLIEKIGESGSCNVDVVCRIDELGPAFAAVKNAVAKMQFIRTGGGSFICTGTLLNDTVPATQAPYFHTANHCFTDNGSIAPVASQMQSVANTLTTIWNYETTGCGNLTQTSTTQVSGGATYLYSSHLTDGMLLRLNNAPPAGAYFAGWNAKSLVASDAITGIHHPAGDSKMVSTGQTRSIHTNVTRVGWLSGTTEGGSSGSGLFSLGANGYVLRGGLWRGDASCSNTGSLANSANWDEYSRFDIDFPNLKSWLEPEPEAANGSRPLLRPRPANKTSSTASELQSLRPADSARDARRR